MHIHVVGIFDYREGASLNLAECIIITRSIFALKMNKNTTPGLGCIWAGKSEFYNTTVDLLDTPRGHFQLSMKQIFPGEY